MCLTSVRMTFQHLTGFRFKFNADLACCDVSGRCWGQADVFNIVMRMCRINLCRLPVRTSYAVCNRNVSVTITRS